ncbi:MAG: hypothetical protein EBX52_13885 [Proteobacteria bacterium]|nr:hypothetical protein [Pseudomonadota bacterium]
MANYVSSREVLPFIYTVDITISSLSGTGTKTLATALNNPVQAPDNFKILVKDISTGRDLFTNALNRSLICGNASNYFIPEGYRIRFPRQNQLQFDFTNLYTAWPTGASSIDITFALRGYKIFGQMG